MKRVQYLAVTSENKKIQIEKKKEEKDVEELQ